MTKKRRTPEEIIRRWLAEPVTFVRQVFHEEPDAWQADGLNAIRDHKRTAFSACKGPGKSRLLAWALWWFISLRTDAQAMALSITKENLRDNLWKELAGRHQASDWLRVAFDMQNTRVVSVERPNTWWISARAFAKDADPEAQANSLAGFHAKYVMNVLDEVGDIPLGVLSSAEAIHSTADTFSRTVAAGNPTNVQGSLGEICNRARGRWHVIYITGDPDDPKRSPRIDIEEARTLIAQLGRDHPWVRVNVLGLFPLKGTDALIGSDEVAAAMGRDVNPNDVAADANIFGLDPARFGDDEQVLMRRKGLVAWNKMKGDSPFWRWRGLDGEQLAVQVISRALQPAEDTGDPCDVLFVDVGGVGASAFDFLKSMGWGHVISAVDFAGRPMNPRLYYNHRAEMWSLMAEWIKKRPSALPNDAVLAAELVAPKYSYRVVQRQTRLILESKEDMRARGVPSPNRGDALALTFAGPAFRRSKKIAAEENPRGRNTSYLPREQDA